VSADILTVVWKEWRALIHGRARRQVILTAGMMGVWAVIMPIQMGRDWITDPIPMGLIGFVLPTIVVGVIVPDSIAGERERRTLSTLLASRLPDRAILVGKLGFAVVAGWLTTPFALAVALVAANVAAGDGQFVFYDPAVLAVVLALGLLGGLFTGAIGLFVSLRTPTAQEAQQLTVMAVMVPFMVLGLGATLLLANRGMARDLFDWLGSQDARLAALALLALVALVDAFLVMAADRRFRRGRLAER
jgi:ABC-2 type transport system permease protein